MADQQHNDAWLAQVVRAAEMKVSYESANIADWYSLEVESPNRTTAKATKELRERLDEIEVIQRQLLEPENNTDLRQQVNE